MLTVHLCGASANLSTLIGVPLGVLAVLNKLAGTVIKPLIDMLRSPTSFVYLIPVAMPFRGGHFNALNTIALYAQAPSERRAGQGARSVSEELMKLDYAGLNAPMFYLGGLASNNRFLPKQLHWAHETYLDGPVEGDLRHRHSAMKCASLLRKTTRSIVSEVTGHSRVSTRPCL